MSSAVNVFVHALCKLSKKWLAQKVVHFGSPRWIPMFQPPLESPWVALQYYETGTKVSHQAVPELLNYRISVLPHGISRRVYQEMYANLPSS